MKFLKNIQQELLHYHERTKSLQSLYGKPMVYMNRVIDLPFTFLDAVACTAIVGSIVYLTTQELYWSYGLAAVFSFAGHFMLRYFINNISASFAYKLVQRDTGENKGYAFMRYASVLVAVGLFSMAVVISLKTDQLVRASGKVNLDIKSEESIKEEYKVRRAQVNADFNKRIAKKDAEVMHIDTSAAFRNSKDRILTRWANSKAELQKSRTVLENSKIEEIRRLDKMEATALSDVRAHNKGEKADFEKEFIVSGSFANGANIAVTFIRLIFALIYGYFVYYAVKEDNDMIEQAKENAALSELKKEKAAQERKEAMERKAYELEQERKDRELKRELKRARELAKIEENKTKQEIEKTKALERIRKAQQKNYAQKAENNNIENAILEEKESLLSTTLNRQPIGFRQQSKRTTKMDNKNGQQNPNEQQKRTTKPKWTTSEMDNKDNKIKPSNRETYDENGQQGQQQKRTTKDKWTTSEMDNKNGQQNPNGQQVKRTTKGTKNGQQKQTTNLDRQQRTTAVLTSLDQFDSNPTAILSLLSKQEMNNINQKIKRLKSKVDDTGKKGVIIDGKWRNARNISSTLSTNRQRLQKSIAQDEVPSVKVISNIILFQKASDLVRKRNR